MTKLLQQAIIQLQELPATIQDSAAVVLLRAVRWQTEQELESLSRDNLMPAVGAAGRPSDTIQL